MTCDTCKWADDEGQQPGAALCRKRPPGTAVIPGRDGANIVPLWPPVRLATDFCSEHEAGRTRLKVVRTFPDGSPVN